MTDDERAAVAKAARDEALKEADLLGRLNAVEASVAKIKDAAEATAKWIGRAVLGGIVWLVTEIADKIPQSWWPK